MRRGRKHNRMIAVLLLIMMVVLAGCGTKKENPATDVTPTAEATLSATPTEEPTATPDEGAADDGSDDMNDTTPGTSDGTGLGADSDGSDLAGVMDQLLEGAGLEIKTDTFPVDNAVFSSYFFIDPIDGAENVVSEAMINAQAHSVCLLRLPEDADAAAVAADIEANANPMKWICVEAEKTIVKQSGNMVLLVMSYSDPADKIAENFDALFK